MNRPKLKIAQPPNQTWKKLTMPVHFITLIASIVGAATVCMAYVGMTSPSERFIKIETRQDKLDDDIGDIKTGQARIEQKVDDLRILVKHR